MISVYLLLDFAQTGRAFKIKKNKVGRKAIAPLKGGVFKIEY